MKERIKEIMSLVFETEVSAIDDNASPDSIDNWDSIRALNLVTALEEAYGISFTDEELTEMLNLELIIHIVEEKVNAG
jgi:acyl carrier protein